MSNNNNEWIWDARLQLHCIYLGEGNWLFENGNVIDQRGYVVRTQQINTPQQQFHGTSGADDQLNRQRSHTISSTSVQDVASQFSNLNITQGTTSQQSHVTTSPTVYAQASQGFVSQYPVRPYPNPIVTTGYQVNQYASGSYGANPHLSYSNTIAPQPAATMPYGGVQKFQNPEQATDAELLVKGIKSYRKFGGIVPSNYQLDTTYQVPKNGRAFFVFGKVFTTMWAEMLGCTTPCDEPTVVTDCENIWVKIRWFVVIRAGRDHSCTCLPIQTYQRRGVSKPGTIKSEHAIIYSTRTPPEPLTAEAPRLLEDGTFESDMREPIRVVPKHKTEELDPISRVNFVKLYTVEHNTRVREFGFVHEDHEHLLRRQFYQCWGVGRA